METTIDIIITDMGNGTSFCNNCGTKLDDDPVITLRDNLYSVKPKGCTKCHATFVGYTTFMNMGGSDF